MQALAAHLHARVAAAGRSRGRSGRSDRARCQSTQSRLRSVSSSRRLPSTASSSSGASGSSIQATGSSRSHDATAVGAIGARAAAVRARIQATVVRRAPQVMVKVTGGGRGMGAIAAHFRYISKGGRLPFEDDRGVVQRRQGGAARPGRAVADTAARTSTRPATGARRSTSCCRCRAAPIRCRCSARRASSPRPSSRTIAR